MKLIIAATLALASSLASAQDVLLTGQVQRVILQPAGMEDCPPPCPMVTPGPDGSYRVCISNGGGCETMDVRVERVYRGAERGATRQFKARIGEWGPRFPVTASLIVVSEEAGKVAWSPATQRDGAIFFDPERLPTIGGVPTSETGDGQLVALDGALARARPVD